MGLAWMPWIIIVRLLAASAQTRLGGYAGEAAENDPRRRAPH